MTKPEPYCPECGGRMRLLRPKAGQTAYEPFWGCTQYPDCKGKRNIMDDGRPEQDDFEISQQRTR